MKKKYDYIVLIGRFEPPHVGHEKVYAEALEKAEKLIILVGSSFQPRTIKNPWTYNERVEMIRSVLPDVDRVHLAPLRDEMYNDQKWAMNVQRTVETIVSNRSWSDYPPKIGLIGHSKDESSYYLKMFPQWDLIEHTLVEIINATDLRTLYFEGHSLRFLKGVVSQPVYEFLDKFRSTDEFKRLEREHHTIKDYKKNFAGLKYPPVFMTCDAVVVQSAHILLVQRGSAPGEGLWALPGGFVNPSERVVDAAIRELREETGLKVPAPVLKGSIKAEKLFDKPDRSLRGRTFTMAYHIELPAGDLPPIKGGDDAVDAKWIPLSEVKEEVMFEDHMAIIRYFTGV